MIQKSKKGGNFIFKDVEFKNKVYGIRDNIEVLGEYTRLDDKIKIKCRKCGHKWNVLARGLVYYKSCHCPNCSDVKLRPNSYWNLATMRDYASEFEYDVLDMKLVDKKNANPRKSVYVKCPSLKHKPYWTRWERFLSGNRCLQCYRAENSFTIWNEQSIRDFFSSFNYEILDINEWVGVDQNMSFKDNMGFKYVSSVTNLRRNVRAYNNKESTKRFHVKNPYSLENIDLFCKLFRPDYEIISRVYKGIDEPYIWRYNGNFIRDSLNNDIDRNFICSAYAFIYGQVNHPGLTMSKLALKISQVLYNYGIKYETEKAFDGCISKRALKFDFYIQSDQNHLDLPYEQICIEADGIQHEELVPFWDKTIDSFHERIERDKIKDDFCNRNNIKLIRISYRDAHLVEEIIASQLCINIDGKYVS